MVKKLLLEDENLTFANACKIIGDLESVMQTADQFGDNNNAGSVNMSAVSYVNSRRGRVAMPRGRGRYNKQLHRGAWTCYKCELRGYTARFCPNNDVKTADSVMAAINSNPCLSISGVADLRPLTKTLYINKVELKVYVDCGSSVTMWSLSTYNAKLSNHKLLLYIGTCLAANGASLNIYGIMHILFSKTICSNNGEPFASQEFKQYCQYKGIKLAFSPSYSPQPDGLAKRAVQTFKRMLTKSVLDNSNKDDILTDCLFSFRATPSSVTGVSPIVAILT
ncbi:hypothetical protein ILUMI_20881 [Ignelater luminosus]|uniref:Integrase catalytic domain-containing protein n=1 Tax=Ignelater luminosus TaxID=2038154 RepID=A0A8K0CDI5_IGNLU|nr:hypothetical protein ILUMI_20881 [Ignelater luminosus]